MLKMSLAFLGLLALTACATSSPRQPSSDANTAQAEAYLKTLVANSKAKKILTCFDALEMGPVNAIDFYQTSDLNNHCVAVFKDLREKKIIYRRAYGCWPTDISNKPLNPFTVAQNNKQSSSKLEILIEGNYSAFEVMQVVSQMTLEYHPRSNQFIGALNGVPEMPFGTQGSCADASR